MVVWCVTSLTRTLVKWTIDPKIVLLVIGGGTEGVFIDPSSVCAWTATVFQIPATVTIRILGCRRLFYLKFADFVCDHLSVEENWD